MRVFIEQLEAGDEIIISSYSDLKYMRVLQKPEKSKTKKLWRSDEFAWKAVKCAINKTTKKHPYFEKEYEVYDCNPDDLNTTIYKELAGRDIWLVKKGVKL